MNKETTQKAVAAAVTVIALLLMLIGCFRSYKVYDQKDAFAEFGLVTFSRVSDRQLVEDATFTGTMRDGEKLYSTYDRSAPRAKRACPT